MHKNILVVAGLLSIALASTACKKGDATASSTSTTAAALPTDAKTVAAFKDANGFTDKLKGEKVKVHGYAQSVSSNNVPISDGADKPVPFVFCDAAKLPEGLKAKDHVLAEGTAGQMGALRDCTLSKLAQ